MKKILVIIIVLIFGGTYVYYNYANKDKVILPPAQNYQNFVASTSVPHTDTTTPPVVLNLDYPLPTNTPPLIQNEEIKKSINLAVPFTSQAPSTNWDQPFQDACEEASILMVDYYFKNKKFGSAAETEKILVDMVDWQVNQWGTHHDITLAEVKEFMLAHYDYQVDIINDITVEKIKGYLQKGLPVIVPADGKKLNNPNFRNGGPPYHMLVIKGYIDDNFITNDPGTRKGADYIYSSATIMNALGDWNASEHKSNGPKSVIVVSKK